MEAFCVPPNVFASLVGVLVVVACTILAWKTLVRFRAPIVFCLAVAGGLIGWEARVYAYIPVTCAEINEWYYPWCGCVCVWLQGCSCDPPPSGGGGGGSGAGDIP